MQLKPIWQKTLISGRGAREQIKHKLHLFRDEDYIYVCGTDEFKKLPCGLGAWAYIINFMKINIKKGDTVKVIKGKDRGKTGKVLQVLPKFERISIEGLNTMIKNLKPRKKEEKGQKIEYPSPMHVSNIVLVCTKCSKSVRVSYKKLADGKKVRICKKCKEAT